MPPIHSDHTLPVRFQPNLNTVAIIFGFILQGALLIWNASALQAQVNFQKQDIERLSIRQDKAESAQTDIVKTLAELSERSKIQTDALKDVSADLRAFLRPEKPKH